MSMNHLNGGALDTRGWSLGRFIDEIGDRYAHYEAIVASDQMAGDTPRRWHYKALATDVRALQWALMREGIQAGDRVGVMISSFPEWILFLFAITRLGATFLPINPRFKSRELRYVMKHSSAVAIVGMGEYLGNDYSALIADAAGKPLARGYSELGSLRKIIGVHGMSMPGALDVREMLEWGSAYTASQGKPPRADDEHQAAILFYTSGTTSFPKGVPLTSANILPHSVEAGSLLELRPGEKVLTLYPFFGISGGANKVLSTFGAGACLVFLDTFRPDQACELMHAEQCSVIHGVDVHIRELIQANVRHAKKVQQARRGTVAFTAGVDEKLARDMGPGLGLYRFIHPYGMTETNPMILRNHLDDPFEVAVKAGGRTAPNVDIRIVDPQTGENMALDKEGEIMVRGPTVTCGYLNDPASCSAAFTDGWFHTGDRGIRSSDGFVFYTGRLKDMLKVGGFNVAPQEIEGALKSHQSIEDAAVTSRSDARLGEVPIAFVKLRPGSHTNSAEIGEWCRAHIANFKVPRVIYIVEELPYQTAAHGAKLQRHVLREWALQFEKEHQPDRK
ncbi:MAG: class I adenylate-forming enzyme family protein [Advenella sp.]